MISFYQKLGIVVAASTLTLGLAGFNRILAAEINGEHPNLARWLFEWG